MDIRAYSRRRFVAGTTTAGVAVGLLAISRTAAAQEATPSASPAASLIATDQFPVTISHVYGETVISAAPVRIVTHGWSTQDAVIALGIDPVAIPRNDFGADADGFLPWTREALGNRPLPVLLDTLEVPYEAIAAATPDVILAPYSGITQEEYGLLSQIAPTVAYPETAWGTSWQDDQLITGEALGLSEAADTLVADAETLIASQTDQYPQLAGKTFVYGNMGDGASFSLYTTTDSRPLFLAAIGLVPSDYTRSLDAKAEAATYYVPVSYELAGEIEGDIVVFWFGSQADYDAAVALPAFQAIPAVKRGSFAPVIGEGLVMASSAFSVLSIPYMLDEFIPVLAAAADKV